MNKPSSDCCCRKEICDYEHEPGCPQRQSKEKAMTQPIYHHKFRPWRVVEDQRIVAAEASWKKAIKWNREALNATRDYGVAHRVPTRPRVLVDVDVFEDWGGFVCNSRGEPLHAAEKWLRGKSGSGGSEWLAVPGQFVGRSLVNLDDVRARLFATIDATPNIDWLLLTKRPENIRRMWRTPSSSPCMQGDGFVSHDYVGDTCRRCGVPHRENAWLGVSISCQDDADRLIPELLKCRDLCAKLLVFRDGEFSEVPT